MARLLKTLRFVFHSFSIIFIAFFFARNTLNPIIQKKITRYHPDMKHLLIWSSLPGVKNYGQKHFIEKNCIFYNCYFTKNRSLFGDLRYFDGIIFNLQEVSGGIQDLPSVRNKYQKYIFAANDSADNYPVCNPVYDSFFNWTWTYKRRSTIPYRFVTIFNLRHQELGSDFNWDVMKPLDDKTKNEFALKSKAAAIFLDKCVSRSKREVFLNSLQKHLLKYNMTVDVFGKCGTMECRRKSMKPCFWKLKKYYFFYLALEDSLAEDYVTRTVLYAYRNNVVPVVYGKAAYDRKTGPLTSINYGGLVPIYLPISATSYDEAGGYLPPGSFLNGFELGAEKLALNMYQIAYDPSRYLQFFKWRKYYKVEKSQILDACSLCTALNNPNWLTHNITYHNFRQWWNQDYKTRCYQPSDVIPSYFTF